jgi:hypothetical protein
MLSILYFLLYRQQLFVKHGSILKRIVLNSVAYQEPSENREYSLADTKNEQERNNSKEKGIYRRYSDRSGPCLPDKGYAPRHRRDK